MAVLFRINAQSPAIEQALADRNIPYLVRGGERFYERPEVRQALLTLRTNARTLTGAERGSAVEQMKAILHTLGWSPQPPEGGGALRERWESLAALLSVAEDLQVEAHAAAELSATPPNDQDPLTLQAVSAELDRRAEAQHVPAAQGVTVSTLHSAKGLEWDAVALLGIHEGSLPFILATSPEQISEERRLLYVGVTRARRLLRISWSRTRNGNGQPRRPSHFLEPVLPEALPCRLQPSHRGLGGIADNRRSRSTADPVGDHSARLPSARSAATWVARRPSMIRRWRCSVSGGARRRLISSFPRTVCSPTPR
jgi:DNA helicase-2/ATP-dependent DNA helicase PcrA